MKERLQKVISDSGYTSRRNAEKLIVDGKVLVNGEIVRELGVKVSSDDIIEVEGTTLKKKENHLYFMLNKPVGYITSTKDDRSRKTVLDFFKDYDESLYPVGRLDYETSGMIFITNDGEFKNLIENPVFEMEKEYHVKVKGLLRKEESYLITRGRDLGDYKTKPCRIYNVKYNDEKTNTMLDIVIKEGKNREIRRLFDSINHEVKSLRRTRIGNVILDINEGYYRALKPHEVKILKLMALGKVKN